MQEVKCPGCSDSYTIENPAHDIIVCRHCKCGYKPSENTRIFDITKQLNKKKV